MRSLLEQQHQIAVNQIKIELELAIMRTLILKRMALLNEILGDEEC